MNPDDDEPLDDNDESTPAGPVHYANAEAASAAATN